jgi:hypothetical protein
MTGIPHKGCKSPGECRREELCMDAWRGSSEASAPILTFEINKDRQGVWLCTTDGKCPKRVARFVSEEAAKSFVDVLNLMKMSQHAMGQLGI